MVYYVLTITRKYVLCTYIQQKWICIANKKTISIMRSLHMYQQNSENLNRDEN